MHARAVVAPACLWPAAACLGSACFDQAGGAGGLDGCARRRRAALGTPRGDTPAARPPAAAAPHACAQRCDAFVPSARSAATWAEVKAELPQTKGQWANAMLPCLSWLRTYKWREMLLVREGRGPGSLHA